MNADVVPSRQAGSNRDRALRAAVQITGSQGIRALTHARVDSTAGMPAGSTSNCFRTRAALVQATVGHIARTERELFAAGRQPQSIEELVDALIGFVDVATGPRRELSAARLAFFVEGFHDESVRATLAEARAHLDTWAAQTLEGLGFPRPFAAARRILTHLEGQILHHLTFDNPPGPREDIEAVVRSCAR